MVTNLDSFDKVAQGYFAALTRKPFWFKGKKYLPKDRVIVSPLIFRGFSCPPTCGGCCARVTLDYLPFEPHPEYIGFRTVEFDGKAFALLSDLQEGSDSPKCKHLRYSDGRCDIHMMHPMLCDVELTKFIHYDDKAIATSRLYGRGWAFTRVDGQKGARCSMLPVSDESIAETLRKLNRIRDWCIYFEVDSWIDEIIEWTTNYPSSRSSHLILSMNGGNTLLHEFSES